MSATGRGAVRHERDFYSTPAWCVDRLLDDILPQIRVSRPDGVETWLEPCVGSGAIVEAVEAYFERQQLISPLWLLSDIEPHLPEGWPPAKVRDYAGPLPGCTYSKGYSERNDHDGPIYRYAPDTYRLHKHGLYVGTEWCDGLFDVGITNPPFSHAERITKNMMTDCRLTAVLQRVNWLGSAPRSAWFHETQPAVRVLPDRPTFQWHGQTDATEYAWFLFTHPWDTEYAALRGTVKVLGVTPAEVRSAQRPPRPAGAIRPGKKRKT